MAISPPYHLYLYFPQVEAPKPKEESQYASMDVMSILSRRQVIQLSESEGDSDSSEFNQDWED